MIKCMVNVSYVCKFLKGMNFHQLKELMRPLLFYHLLELNIYDVDRNLLKSTLDLYITKSSSEKLSFSFKISFLIITP